MRMFVFGVLLAATLGAPLDSAADTPNIVIILADDLGYGDPACYNDQSKIPTPHIDRLATQGLRFTDAHTPSSVCTPTRYGLLTGRYCWRTALKRSVLWPWDPPLIEADRLTLPGMLKKHGYRTACIGKWHLGWDWPLRDGGFIADEFNGHTIPANKRQAFGQRIDFRRPTRGGPTTRGFDFYFGDAGPKGGAVYSAAGGDAGPTVLPVHATDGAAHTDRPVTAFYRQEPGRLVWRLRPRSRLDRWASAGRTGA